MASKNPPSMSFLGPPTGPDRAGGAPDLPPGSARAAGAPGPSAAAGAPAPPTAPGPSGPGPIPRLRPAAGGLLSPLALFLLLGCGGGDDHATLVEAADAFWDNLAYHCGNAYPGSLTLEPPGDDMLRGDELLVVHFRSCSQRELQLPFHIEVEEGEWNRSRTWIFIRHTDGGLELRHDHRLPDGSDDDLTWYGGFVEEAGTADRQEFIYRDVEYPDGSTRGWRIEIEPEERYTYGTIRNGEWTWRVDFDLSRPLREPPPAPWGY